MASTIRPCGLHCDGLRGRHMGATRHGSTGCLHLAAQRAVAEEGAAATSELVVVRLMVKDGKGWMDGGEVDG